MHDREGDSLGDAEGSDAPPLWAWFLLFVVFTVFGYVIYKASTGG